MRPLKQHEYELIAAILDGHPNRDALMHQLNNAMVEDMNDGGMGSLKFHNTEHKVYGRDIGGIDWIDTDGTPVFIDLLLDSEGDLFELDSFKGDFSKLIKFPVPPYNIVNRINKSP